jgi:threonine dehydrogenase-like Zn-dependent dehydrogenase
MYMAPGSVVFPIKEDVSLKTAVLITGVLANVVQWISLLGQIKVGDTILIQGMGVQGLGAIIAAREAGASKIFISGLSGDRDRFDLALQLGAHKIINADTDDPVQTITDQTDSRGADLVLDVTGNPGSIATALDAVCKQGTVVEAGLIGGNTEVPIILDRIMQKEIRLQGARSKGYQATAAAVSIAESGKYPLDRIVTAEFPLMECARAIETAAGKDNLKPLKVVLVP